MWKRRQTAHRLRKTPVICVRCEKEISFDSPHWSTTTNNAFRLEMCDSCHATPQRPVWFWECIDQVRSIYRNHRLLIHGGSPSGVAGGVLDGASILCSETVCREDFVDLAADSAKEFTLNVEILQREFRPEDSGLTLLPAEKSVRLVSLQDKTQQELFPNCIELFQEIIRAAFHDEQTLQLQL